jgi:hypothetical protein
VLVYTFSTHMLYISILPVFVLLNIHVSMLNVSMRCLSCYLLQIQISRCSSNYTPDVTCLQSDITFIFVSKGTETISVEITDNEFYILRLLLILRGPMMSRFHLEFIQNELWDKY